MYLKQEVKKTQNISEVIAGFQLWEKEIEKADHEALLYQQARTEWEKIKPEYLKSYNETKKKSSAVKGQVIDEEKILNNETTRDMLTRYLQNLRVSKNWEKMRSFIHEVQWLSEVEKTSILENISNWENTDSASETNQKNVKIKIQK
jgi:transcriptional regulator of met regulon